MAWDFFFDPDTHDIVIVNGSPRLTEAADTMVQHQLSIHFNEWWGGPQIGARIHDLRAFVASPELGVKAELQRALNVVAARGRIANIEVDAEAQGAGRTAAATRFRDVPTNTTVALRVKAGG